VATSSHEPDEDAMADTCLDAASARAAALSSDGVGSPALRPVVPRLSLPTSVPAVPQVHLNARSMRLSGRASDRARYVDVVKSPCLCRLAVSVGAA
jgi:hypothetical protein